MKRGVRFGIVCFLLCGVCLSFFACRPIGKDLLAACKVPFSASVSGELNGEKFCAEITATEQERRISFSSPPALNGLELTVSGERVTLCRGSVTIQTNKDSLRGLLRPLTVLTETTAAPLRIEKQGDQYTATFPGKLSFTVSDRGLPRFVSFPEGSFRILDFSRG